MAQPENDPFLQWEAQMEPGISEILEHPVPELADAETAVRIMLADKPWKEIRIGDSTILRRSTEPIPFREGDDIDEVTFQESIVADGRFTEVRWKVPSLTHDYDILRFTWGIGQFNPTQVWRNTYKVVGHRRENVGSQWEGHINNHIDTIYFLLDRVTDPELRVRTARG